MISEVDIADMERPVATVGQLLDYLTTLPLDMKLNVLENVSGPAFSYAGWDQPSNEQFKDVVRVIGGELWIGKK